MEITGKIVDSISKEAIPFTSVLPVDEKDMVVGGGSIGAKTDFDGNYKIKIPDNYKFDSLLIRPSDYTYKNKKVKPSGQKVINVELDYAKGVQELKETVVTTKTNATLCDERGGTWIPTKEGGKQFGECKTKPRFDTPKINWKKRILIGSLIVLVFGVGSYLIIKKIRK